MKEEEEEEEEEGTASQIGPAFLHTANQRVLYAVDITSVSSSSYLSLCGLFSAGRNVALRGTASQIGTAFLHTADQRVLYAVYITSVSSSSYLVFVDSFLQVATWLSEERPPRSARPCPTRLLARWTVTPTAPSPAARAQGPRTTPSPSPATSST